VFSVSCGIPGLEKGCGRGTRCVILLRAYGLHHVPHAQTPVRGHGRGVSSDGFQPGKEQWAPILQGGPVPRDNSAGQEKLVGVIVGDRESASTTFRAGGSEKDA